MDRADPPFSRLAIGLAALGRPAYITLDREEALGADRAVDTLRRRTHEVLDAGYAAGVRHVDAARSYGLAEDFLGSWLESRPDAVDVVVSSKWGYRYVGEWSLSADVHEVKDHSLTTFRRQWAETVALLGPRVSLYQIHSVTPESTALDDRGLLDALAALRDSGVRVGLSTSGPGQSSVIRDALDVEVGGAPLFSAVQATWNVLEPSAGDALAAAADAGWFVMVKEVLANGRLAGSHAPAPLAVVAADLGLTSDAAAIAAALALPFTPTVLLGPVSVPQLASNLTAVAVDPPMLEDRLAGLVERPEAYWAHRSTLAWH